MRTCTKCGAGKELTKEFFRFNNQRASFYRSCRGCDNKSSYNWAAKNPEKRREITKAWRTKNPEKVKAIKKRWKDKNPEADSIRLREREYGITDSQYQQMFEKQGGKCAICGLVFFKGSRKTVAKVDHCHETGIVRGLLCHGCNVGIGFLKDDFFTVIKAASYLRKFLT